MVMIITAFGVFVYSTFTIIAGCLNVNSEEPKQLVVLNGIVELLEVNFVFFQSVDVYILAFTEEPLSWHLRLFSRSFLPMFSHNN